MSTVLRIYGEHLYRFPIYTTAVFKGFKMLLYILIKFKRAQINNRFSQIVRSFPKTKKVFDILQSAPPLFKHLNSRIRDCCFLSGLTFPYSQFTTIARKE